MDPLGVCTCHPKALIWNLSCLHHPIVEVLWTACNHKTLIWNLSSIQQPIVEEGMDPFGECAQEVTLGNDNPVREGAPNGWSTVLRRPPPLGHPCGLWLCTCLLWAVI